MSWSGWSGSAPAGEDGVSPTQPRTLAREVEKRAAAARVSPERERSLGRKGEERVRSDRVEREKGETESEKRK